MESRNKPVVSVSYSYNPLEETLEIPRRNHALFIGIPREDSLQENRVALTPQAVSVLVANGNQVVVEHNAGLGSSFTDNEFPEAGAQIVHDKAEVYKALS